ncbi:pimeloyl-ACP methyl ester carboxylesterase [Gelidibacter sediminis]|uniref:Pimeloyl-ACP methyl ester carboxylesterase n=1 Tax=Gelidibacter sediminis TaxID=1608710 RepID=A0A4R7QAM2_9FLAO|nr:alpha/beta fold hydrolase [Gelidibacter sediminis]TDU43820.1 pimeloyl-ACP methyl ester carboxylesterase [Gelidibacter sediminis]
MNLHSNILGKGQTFIFLHGFLGMSDNWKTLGTTFSEEGYEVHLIDQRNHGRSFHSDEFNYEVMVADLKRYCDIHKLNDIVLLGHSMGGKTAMLFAVEYPQLVSKLIIADISPRYYPTHHDDILKGLSALNFDVLKTRGEADAVMKRFVPDVGTRQFLLKNLYWKEKGMLALRMNLEVLKDQVNEVGEPLPMHTKFEKETLFLRGDRSEYISLQDENLIYTHFPKAKIVTIANAGHWLHAENPTDFYNEVNSFLKDEL